MILKSIMCPILMNDLKMLLGSFQSSHLKIQILYVPLGSRFQEDCYIDNTLAIWTPLLPNWEWLLEYHA